MKWCVQNYKKCGKQKARTPCIARREINIENIILYKMLIVSAKIRFLK